VVTVTSLAEIMGSIRFDDLQRRKSYERWTAYGQSKLANLLFAIELERRFRAHGSQAISLAAHPGFAESNLRKTQLPGSGSALQRFMLNFFEWMSQDGFIGVLPQLYAATAERACGGCYYGPDGFAQIHGYPRQVEPTRKARNPELARRLWQASEELTGVRYTWPKQA
jgi:NAD(P)-dependent dehydrogenase (short-subunit alcohol dehydrogenase family)